MRKILKRTVGKLIKESRMPIFDTVNIMMEIIIWYNNSSTVPGVNGTPSPLKRNCSTK